MTRMFHGWETTINPLAGACRHQCSYCWVESLKERYPAMAAKYSGPPRLVEAELRRIERAEGRVFVGSCTDIMGDWVPSGMIQLILDAIHESEAKVLLCTKNPARYHDFDLPSNAVAGATVETDLDHAYPLTGAPSRLARLVAMMTMSGRKMISIEPIMRHSPELAALVIDIDPDFVFVGYDNYDNHLPEPSLAETRALIDVLRDTGVMVYEKTIREEKEKF